jgi:putative flippase GtrA
MSEDHVSRGVGWSAVERLVSPSRLGMFLVVGGTGAVCDNAALALLHGYLGVPLALAKLGSAEAAILVMFALNERWTFAGEGDGELRALARRFVTSHTVRLVGLGVGMTVLLALAELASVWYIAANVVGLGAGFVSNYVFESLVTWRVGRG